MSTTKISDLPVLSSADAADEFVVVDDSAGVTKKIAASALNGSLDASALDDYEEGTWTVTNAGDATGTLSATTGTYIKIGKFVLIKNNFQVESNFTDNELGGLPFPVSNSNAGPSSVVGTTIVGNNSDSSLGGLVLDDPLNTINFVDGSNVQNLKPLTTTMNRIRLQIVYTTT